MSILNRTIIVLIKFYKKLISPFIGQHCRYYPTCSSYTITAFKRFNFFKAFYLSTKRIFKCNPFFKGGLDQVPKKEENDL